MEEKKNTNMFVIILIGLFLMAASFGCGYFLNNFNSEKCKNENNFVDNPIKEKEESSEEIIKITDQYVVNTYGGSLRYYMISNGKVYYKYSKELFAGLNVCPSDKDYCKYNRTYNNEVTEISDISGAKKIKLVQDIHASDESFLYFVIAENKVYNFFETKDMNMNFTGVKVILIEELSNKDIIDLIDYNNDKYIFITSDNKQIEY